MLFFFFLENDWRSDNICSVGAQFILGSWYRKSELGVRAAVFCVFGQLGTMSGGWMQAGLLETLAGKGGLPAWKWIFIIVSVMTIPVALFGETNSGLSMIRTDK